MDFQNEILVQDGDIVYKRLTSDALDQTILLMEEAFWKFENFCTCFGIPTDAAALKELRQFSASVAVEGLSIIAVDATTNKVVGAALNRYIWSDPSYATDFDAFAAGCKEARSIALMGFLHDMDKFCDLFEICKIDCLMELLCLGVALSHRKKGIGKKLCEVSIALGEKLARGCNLRQAIDGKKLDLPASPKIISSLFTTIATQKIGQDLGFRVVNEKRMDELEHEGTKFSTVIGSTTSAVLIAFKDLI